MSSFWNFFSSKESSENQASDSDDSDHEAAPAEGSTTSPTMPPAPKAAPVTASPSKAPSISPKALPPKPAYGIDDAIRLMRTLPVDQNVDLVVRVVKNTLESLHVRVTDILADAGKRQDLLRENISDLETAITHFQREIEERRQEIARLQDELAETTSVRERLQLAEATSSDDPSRSKPPPPKPGALPGVLITPATPPPAAATLGASAAPAGAKPASGAAPPLPTRRAASSPPKDEANDRADASDDT